MSLINDALKRAKTAQQQAPAAPVAPQLKPVEPQLPARAATGFFIPAALIALALMALFIIWRIRNQSGLEATLPVRAQEPAAVTTATPSTSSAAAASARTLTAPREELRPEKTVVSTSAGKMEPTASPQTNVPALGNSDRPTEITNLTLRASSTTNAQPAAVAPPQPPPLKLQGVVYDLKRPSAVINGRTLFLGDKIREMRVTAITVDTATLVGAGRTNVLTMAE